MAIGVLVEALLESSAVSANKSGNNSGGGSGGARVWVKKQLKSLIMKKKFILLVY